MNPNNINIQLPRVNPLRRTGRQNNNLLEVQGMGNLPEMNENANQQLNLFNIPLHANINIQLPGVNPLRRTGRQNNNLLEVQGMGNLPEMNENANQQLNLFNIPLHANNNDNLQGIQTPPRVNANQNQQLNFFNTPPQVPRNLNHLLNAPEPIHAGNFREERFANRFIPDEERLILEEANRRMIRNRLEHVNMQNNFPRFELGWINMQIPREGAAQLNQIINNNQIPINQLPPAYLQALENNGFECIFSGNSIQDFIISNTNVVLLQSINIYYLFNAAPLQEWINRCYTNNHFATHPITRVRITAENIVNPMQVDPLNIR